MKPIVHGLERRYQGRVSFIYLNVMHRGSRDAAARYGVPGTPTFVLTRADGSPVRRWTGTVSEASLVAALDAVAARQAAR